MENVTVNAQLVRAAQCCQASKDVRYYLNGFLLAANGDIVGTDGHRMFKGKYANGGEHCPPIENDTIIALDAAVPAGAKLVTFDFITNVARTDKGKVIGFQIIDGNYPQYSRVIPDDDRENAEDDSHFLCPVWADIPKIFGKDGSFSVNSGGAHNPTRLNYTGKRDALQGACLVLMPARR